VQADLTAQHELPRSLKVNVDTLKECLQQASPAAQGTPPTLLPTIPPIPPNNSIIGSPWIKVSRAVCDKTSTDQHLASRVVEPGLEAQ
jgi:hypothetical protein